MQGGLNAQPISMSLNRETSAEKSFRHIFCNARTRRVNRISADCNMSDSADLSAESHVVADSCRTGNACLRNNQTISADFTIMRNVYKVINFRAVPYNRRTHSRPVNADIRANFHVVFHNDVANLRYFRMHPLSCREPKTVRADNRRTVNHATIADFAIFANRHVGINCRAFANRRVMPYESVRINY